MQSSTIQHSLSAAHRQPGPKHCKGPRSHCEKQNRHEQLANFGVPRKDILAERGTTKDVGFCMVEEEPRKHTGKCYDCGGPLELFELDIKQSTKIMKCQNCGLFHFYKKDFIGNYKLTKVSKNPAAQ
jgi:hypothetical protein